MDFIILLLGGAVLGLAGVFVRLADTTASLGPFASAFWRMAVAAPFLLAWAAVEWARKPVPQTAALPTPGSPRWFTSRPSPPTLLAHWPTWGLALFAAAMFALDLVFFHLAVTWTAVGNATLESNFAPVLITLAFWIITRNAPRPVFLAGLTAALGGAALMIGPNFGHSRALLGDASGLVSAVFYAAYQVGIQQARQRLSTAPLMAVVTLLAALVLWPFALAEGRMWPTATIGWAWVLGLALLVQIGGQVVIAYAVRRLNPALSSVGLLVQPAMAVVYAWILLGEALTAPQLLGAGLVLAGIYLARKGM
ncbi:DMT family transporter [Thiomonas bhubaneswarensis]|uniref:Threonine/homoserine efflux transporter RhtA n=1 Tax=Thiomonas bhubaneswarensis TaxID=339866 RepID=A0A0K6HXA0_9BURK|nr:DMT family transporter [Thiomonas bhubaneswarensis]CUA95647.1 Threonine/homoserine efflux transporter RhtA [Thiomonas bhubaneswarensis]